MKVTRDGWRPLQGQELRGELTHEAYKSKKKRPEHSLAWIMKIDNVSSSLIHAAETLRRLSTAPLKRISHLFACIAICALAGCAGLLPKGKADTRSPFDSFEAAEQALSQVTAYKTTITDLRALGFDLVASDNVTLISYPTVVARLIPSSSVALDAVDPGIRDCVLAQKACQAFEFQIAQQRRQREGNFLMDWLNFRRTTEITGWSFSALIALRYDVVVFTSYGGERSTHRLDQQTNPLGPLQGVGEATAAALVKN